MEHLHTINSLSKKKQTSKSLAFVDYEEALNSLQETVLNSLREQVID